MTVTLNGRPCEKATWKDGKLNLGDSRFPSYITCIPPTDVTGPKSAVITVASQSWEQAVPYFRDSTNQIWYEGRPTSEFSQLGVGDALYEEPSAFFFTSICKNDSIRVIDNVPVLDIYYGSLNEKCVHCPIGAGCLALGFTDPYSDVGFWRTYFPIDSAEATYKGYGCPAERLNRASGFCPLYQGVWTD